MVTFNHPPLLALLILVPGFLLASVAIRRFQRNALGRFGKREILGRFSKFAPKTVPTILTTLALAAIALAAAEPSLSSSQNANSKTLNAVIVLDISRSMLAEDGPGERSRLESGILAIEKLFETYPDGRFGLVVYTNKVLAYAPTFDHEALRFVLRDILGNYTPIRGEGSNPLLALLSTADMIEELPYTINTVFLVSDGGKSLAASAAIPLSESEVMKKLTKLHLRLIVVGVGELTPSAIPVYEDGVLVGYHRFQDQVVYTALEEIPLKRFASESRGIYLRLTDSTNLVHLAQQNNLDSQPIAQDSSANLVWLVTAVSVLLVLVHLMNPRS